MRNEAEVAGVLDRVRFTAVDPGALSVREQINTFAQAELIVGAHGAGLTNLAFASPGARAIELFPAGYLLPDYWWLAERRPRGGLPLLSAPRAGAAGCATAARRSSPTST